MAATPFLVRLGDRLIAEASGEQPEPLTAVESGLRQHVIVAGYGRVGRAIAEMLEETGIPFVVLEQDPRRVPQARASTARCSTATAATHGCCAAWRPTRRRLW